MGRHRKEINVDILHIDRDFPDRLHGVAMEQHAPLAADLADLLDREDHPRLIIRPHDRYECRFVCDEAAQRVRFDDTLIVHGKIGHLDPLFLEEFTGRKDRWVFDFGRDDVVLVAIEDLVDPHRFEDPVVGLGRARCEDDIVVVASVDRLVHLIDRFRDCRMRRRTVSVERIGVSVDVTEERNHRFDDGGVDHRRCIVVQIDLHEILHISNKRQNLSFLTFGIIVQHVL